MLSLKMKCETPDVSKYKEFETPQIQILCCKKTWF